MLDLTLDAARRAESGGDRAAAMLLYQQAASLAPAGGDRAAIRLALAFLYADPTAQTRDLDRARAELNGAVGDLPTGPHAVEARLLAVLLDEIIALRAQVNELKTQSETARSEATGLQARLTEKEKELAEIKKILLRDKGKP